MAPLKQHGMADQAQPVTEEPVPPPRRCACGQVSHHTDGWCGSNCTFSSSPPKPPRIYGHNTHLHTLEPYYSRHVAAMTEEGLHSKSDIAAELAFRDKEIARLALDAEDQRILATTLNDAANTIDSAEVFENARKAAFEAGQKAAFIAAVEECQAYANGLAESEDTLAETERVIAQGDAAGHLAVRITQRARRADPPPVSPPPKKYKRRHGAD